MVTINDCWRNLIEKYRRYASHLCMDPRTHCGAIVHGVRFHSGMCQSDQKPSASFQYCPLWAHLLRRYS